VEAVQGGDERRHGLGRVRAKFDDAIGELPVVTDLDRRHSRQGGPAGQRRRHARVLGETVERGQLAIRENAEKINGAFEVGVGHDFLPDEAAEARGGLAAGRVRGV
jgi:hypothetical protein